MKEPKFGGKMELLKLSRLKQQLRALFTDVKEFRERERSTTEQLHFSIQKQKQSEVQFEKKLKELESELASLTESRQKLERKVSYLQNDNSLLEIKQKELNATVQSLLQSREQFVNAYQESTYDMKRSIEARDRKLKIFSEKLKSHFLLFDSIEKEALSVKQVVDNVRHVVNEKEEAGMYLYQFSILFFIVPLFYSIVTKGLQLPCEFANLFAFQALPSSNTTWFTCAVIGFKRKFDRLSEVEKVFMEKIREMEERLGKYKDELQRKETLISELEAKLEEERKRAIKKGCCHTESNIRKACKEFSISDSLDSELKSLGAVLEKIQHAFTAMNEVFKVAAIIDKGTFLSIVESTGKCCTVPGEEMKRSTTYPCNFITSRKRFQGEEGLCLSDWAKGPDWA
ncbi:Tyrosine-protein phosphatase non-receptor type 23 [Bienertia sinuspersici]